ncbi:RcpC/CpaB family pilus assembly protein [Puerhibacterium puerhi]|uniref:RcpC/CpaB family pilus assembly protein n=1 Tax=Puerhibacterium puerhi TaxID=2692623 RepID=UPI00135BA983|nr:RcpC/CpaB family pilus assembly protein [Puerhibacterium puerhi]
MSPLRLGTRRPPAPDLAAPAARSRARRRALAWLWRSRFVLAAACCGLAVTAAVHALRPPAPPTVDVVVPVRTLAPGQAVSDDDVAVRALPVEAVPEDALDDLGAAVGRTPAVALPAGLPLTRELVAGGEVVAQAPAGAVVVPVVLDGTAADLLRPGDRVDLVTTAAPDPDSPDAAYLARGALVLPSAGRQRDEPSGGGLLGGGAAAGTTDATLLAVSPEEAPAVSAASGSGTVGAVLVP